MLAIAGQTAGPNCLKLFEAKILDIEIFLDQIFFSKFDFFYFTGNANQNNSVIISILPNIKGPDVLTNFKGMVQYLGSVVFIRHILLLVNQLLLVQLPLLVLLILPLLPVHKYIYAYNIQTTISYSSCIYIHKYIYTLIIQSRFILLVH